MATNAQWTIIFEDKMVIKNHAEGASEGVGYIISDDSFWDQSKFSNIWAIQYGASNTSDEVEHKDETPHCSYAEANLGEFKTYIILIVTSSKKLIYIYHHLIKVGYLCEHKENLQAK